MDQPLIAVADFCSACYASGYAEHIKEAEFALDGYVRDITNATQCSQLIGFIESPHGKNIFRAHVATTKPYKSGRKGRDKPPFVNEVKAMAKSKYGFQYCFTYEAEDAMLITANKIGINRVVMCSVDKDTKQQHGLFYDYFKKDFITITPEQAHYNLWHQVCMGDTTDSIVALPGVGSKKAEDILEGIDPSDYPNVVATAYKERGFNYQYFLENCRLIRILRSRTEVWTPLTREQWEAL